MFNVSEFGNLEVQLQKLREQNQKIDKDIIKVSSTPPGTISMSIYRLKKQKDELEDQMLKINSMLYPDIIA